MQIRGSRSLFSNLFQEETSALLVSAPEKKGRSEVLVNKRNELLVCRYYYHIKIMGKQYVPTLKILEEEIFLTQRTITDALQKQQPLLKEMQATKPDVKYFRNKYPWMVW